MFIIGLGEEAANGNDKDGLELDPLSATQQGHRLFPLCTFLSMG